MFGKREKLIFCWTVRLDAIEFGTLGVFFFATVEIRYWVLIARNISCTREVKIGKVNLEENKNTTTGPFRNLQLKYYV